MCKERGKRGRESYGGKAVSGRGGKGEFTSRRTEGEFSSLSHAFTKLPFLEKESGLCLQKRGEGRYQGKKKKKKEALLPAKKEKRKKKAVLEESWGRGKE